MEFHPFPDLLLNAFFRLAVGGIEGVVVTIGASSAAFGAVAVRACKASVDAQLLYTLTEYVTEIIRIGVEPSLMSPGIHGAVKD